MKIKHQLVLLSSFLIATPLLCCLFMCFLHYWRSPERVLMSGSKEIRSIEKQSQKYSKSEWKNIKDTMRTLPPDVQAILMDVDKFVLFSSMPEIQKGVQCSEEDIWKLINKTSDVYFYQFTMPRLKEHKTILITRVIRQKENKKGKKPIVAPMIFFLIFLVLICVCIIAFIYKTIFHSVEQVENTTKDLADGNLKTIIQTSDHKNEITSTLNNLEIMRQSLMEAQNKKNKFIMGVSHDLRTPVAVIKGYSEAIRDGVISSKDDIKKSVELIEQKATLLENMINSLISYTKMETSEIKQTLHLEDFTQIINSFAKEAKITGAIYKRNIITEINLTKPHFIPLDNQLVNRLFENLYSNAIRYSKENDTITIRADEYYTKIVIQFEDTGSGIASENLDNIFDLFYRESSSRREEGMGIGLAVVKNIIDIHGWSISVKSELNKGSCFTIEIPLETSCQLKKSEQ